MSIDWEAEGLLDGVEGEERDARADLLERLHDDGASVDELRRAVAEDRLALLPVERVIGGDAELTPREVADQVGVDLGALMDNWQALGLPRPDPDERVLGQRDVEAARQLKLFLDAGLPIEGIVDVSRIMGQGMARTADAVLDVAGQAFLEAGGSERDVGMRYAEAARQLIPLMEDQLDYVFGRHMLELIRSSVVGATERSTGKLAGAREVAVGFADLVDFTKLGESLPPEDIGRLAGELTELAADVTGGSVRLVKTIGDAAMLVAPDKDALIDSALELVARADEKREGFPQLRAGIAYGPALPRGGDWYGHPVNVASRVTSVARPGSVLVTAGAREGLEDDYDWSFAGKRKLKGVREELPLYRVRRTGDKAEERRPLAGG
jgi:adenylate cyclase